MAAEDEDERPDYWHAGESDLVHQIPVDEARGYRLFGEHQSPWGDQGYHRDWLRKDIEQNGMRYPIEIITDGTNAHISDGHHRLDAAAAAGMSHVPAYVAYLSPKDYEPHFDNNSEIDGGGPVGEGLRRAIGSSERLTFEAKKKSRLQFELSPDDDYPTLPAVQAYLGDERVGQLEWWDDPELSIHNRLESIWVHPEYRRQGIGTALFNHVKNNINPELRQSEQMTPMGQAWSQSMGWKPDNVRPFSQEEMSERFPDQYMVDNPPPRSKTSSLAFKRVADSPWLPHRLNPDPTNPYDDEHYNPDRPRISWEPEDYHQEPIPDVRWPRGQKPTNLWRGLHIDLDHPQWADHPNVQGIKRILYGEQDTGGGLYAPSPSQGNLHPHPASPEGKALSQHILDFAEDVGQNVDTYREPWTEENDATRVPFTKIHDKSDPTWLGRHWTTDPDVADSYAYKTTPGRRGLSVLMRARWDGRGEDLSRANAGGSWPDENEINLVPGTQLDIHGLGIRHPDNVHNMYNSQYHNLLKGQDHEQRTAGAEPFQMRIEHLDPHLVYDREREFSDDPWSGWRKRTVPLVEDVRRNGIGMPVTMATDGHLGILEDGNHRAAAAKIIGLSTVPVRFQRANTRYLSRGGGVPLHPSVQQHLADHPEALLDHVERQPSWAQGEFEARQAFRLTAAFDIEAAVTQDLVDQLRDEFHGWVSKQNPSMDDNRSFNGRGPIGHWPHIEKFLKDRYPAAHRGHSMGHEQARPLLDNPDDPEHEYSMMRDRTPYATGPEAVGQHGYDPSEIAAGMLLLHNKSHRFRGDLAEEDQARLNDIFDKRQQMQRDYEQRTAALQFVRHDVHPDADDDAHAVSAYLGHRPVGRLRWYPGDGELHQIEVHPQYRRHGIASAMFDWAQRNAEPRLHHSPAMTDEGRRWAASMGYRPQEYTHVPEATGALWHTAMPTYLAMPMSDWMDSIQHQPPPEPREGVWGEGRYTIPPRREPGRLVKSKDPIGHLYYSIDENHVHPRVNIDHLETHPDYHKRDVARALMHRLHSDYPDHQIEPGVMTDMGQAFHDRMLEQHPEAAGILTQAFRLTAAFDREAMPAPLPEGLTFHHKPSRYLDESEYSYMEPSLSAHLNGEQVGRIRWHDRDDLRDYAPGEVSGITVAEPHRRSGIATELFDRAKEIEPRLHHSPQRSPLGQQWIDYERSRQAFRLTAAFGVPA